MSMFEDKKYNSMDWLSQATEPIVDPLNDILAKFPNETIVDETTICEIAADSGYHKPNEITKDNIFNAIYNMYTMGNEHLSYDDKNLILTCFDIAVTDESDRPILDMEQKKIFGCTIKFIKIKQQFDENESKKRLGQKGFELLNFNHRYTDSSRLNEIIELMGLSDARKMRSTRQKLDAIRDEYRRLMTTNEWNIRDINLSNRVGIWIRSYLKHGNLAALNNFCKLKIMTHDSMKPIYSITDEEEI